MSWFESYLKGRKQSVSIAGEHSTEKILTAGVPQGSILGPILFILYINDITTVSNLFSPILYADDTTLLSNHSNYEILLQTINNELPKLFKWTVANRLSLNVDKTFAMLFSNRRQNINNDLSIMFNNIPVKFKKSEEFLGLIVDEEVKFAEHTRFVCSKLSKAVGIIYKLRDYVPLGSLIGLYYNLAYPYILYGNLVWGGTFDVHVRPLTIMQKKLIRVLTNSEFLAHTEPLFKRLNILKVPDVHKMLVAQYVYKQGRGGSVRVDGAHNYGTRSQFDERPTFQRLSLTQHSIHYSGPIVWNALPVDVRSSKTLNVFRKQLRQYMLNEYHADES